MAKTDPVDILKDASVDVLKALGERAMNSFGDKVGGLSDKFEDLAGGGSIGKAVTKGGVTAAAKGDSPVGGALKGAMSGLKDKVKDTISGIGGGGGGKGAKAATKAVTIIEHIDVGVPITVAYNQWTEFGEFPKFMRKVENVDAKEDNKLEFKAQIFWSHRSWEATIQEQVPDERIVWRSKGQKGHVDGAVTFHKLGHNLTRILLVLEYYPQGFMEKTGNIWRAQGRRARSELKRFQRHVMTRTILAPDEVEGWRGIIEDGEVVKSHEDVVQEEAEQEQADQEQYDDESVDDTDDSAEEYDEEQPDDEEDLDDEADDEPEDEYEEEQADDEEDLDDEADDGPEDEADNAEYEDEESSIADYPKWQNPKKRSPRNGAGPTYRDHRSRRHVP